LAERINLGARVRSFGYALRGLSVVLRTQHNAWIHVAATLTSVALGLWLGVDASDWAILGIAIAGVWIAESMNTALERLADAAVPKLHPLVRDAKDAAAGAVLVAALLAVLLGLIVLGPPLLAAFRSTSG
jgi:diacylglycerol kinase (ATP)